MWKRGHSAKTARGNHLGKKKEVHGRTRSSNERNSSDEGRITGKRTRLDYDQSGRVWGGGAGEMATNLTLQRDDPQAGRTRSRQI